MKKRFISFQVIRALALISIYVYHQTVADEIFSRWGVCCFFILSGFLNAYHGYGRDMDTGFKGAAAFGIGKIRKIYPLHVTMLVFAFAQYIVGHIGDLLSEPGHFSTVHGIRFALNLSLISDWIPHIPAIEQINGEYNIVTWFLSAILLFYMLTPALISLMHRIYDVPHENEPHNRSIIRNPYTVCVLIYAYVVLINAVFIIVWGKDLSFWHIYESPLSRIGDYLIGMQLGVAFYHHMNREALTAGPDNGKTAKTKNAQGTILLFIALALNLGFILVALCDSFKDYKYLVSSGFYYTIPVAMLIMYAALTEESTGRAIHDSFVGRLFEWLGDMSPYIFLIHYPVITGVHGVYKRLGSVNIYIWSVLSLIITIVAAVMWKNMSRRHDRTKISND